MARFSPWVKGVERPPRSWPPPPRSCPPPMPRWRHGVVGGPSPLRTLLTARLARFSRLNCVFDGRRLELAVRARAEKPAQSASAVFHSTRGFCISATKLGLRLCAHQTCAPCDAPSRRLAAPAPPAPVFAAHHIGKIRGRRFRLHRCLLRALSDG
jgi:hypothetical protein